MTRASFSCEDSVQSSQSFQSFPQLGQAFRPGPTFLGSRRLAAPGMDEVDLGFFLFLEPTNLDLVTVLRMPRRMIELGIHATLLPFTQRLGRPDANRSVPRRAAPAYY